MEGRRQIKKLVPIEEWKDMDRDQEAGPNRGIEGRRQIKKLVPIEEWKDMDRDQDAGPNTGVEGHGQRSRSWSQ